MQASVENYLVKWIQKLDTIKLVNQEHVRKSEINLPLGENISQ